MRQLTRKNLDELAKEMPVISEIQQKAFIGGGNGTSTSPYTAAEYTALCASGTWDGGYVDGWGYVLQEVVVTGSYSGSENNYSSGSNGSGNFGFDPNQWGGRGDPSFWGIPSGNVSDSGSSDYSGWYSYPSGYNDGGGSANSGGSSNGGSSSGGNSNGNNGPGNLTGISDVLSSSAFSGYRSSDSTGCQTRCKEMLAQVGVEMSDNRIKMVSNDGGRAGNALSGAQQGIDTINSALQNGKPIIVGVDYKIEKYNDGLEDHFIVIVGRTVSSDSSGNQVVEYHYFDPRTSSPNAGTSNDNILTLTTDGKLIGTFPETDLNYTVTSVRPNK